MSNRPSPHLHITAYRLEPSLLARLQTALQECGFEVRLLSAESLPDLVRSLVDDLPHVVLMNVDPMSQELLGAIAFAERTFSDLPILLLSEAQAGCYLEGHRLMPIEPLQELVEAICTQAQAPQSGDQQARRMRIMQQIEKNLKAIADIEQHLMAGDLPRELIDSRTYLLHLQASLRQIR